MKLGLVITIFNRPNYTKECFNSIRGSELPKDTILVLVDDCSSNKQVIKLIDEFDIEGLVVVKVRKSKTEGVSKALLNGWDICAGLGADILGNIDNDAIVKKWWMLKLVSLHIKFPNAVVSGFNTISKDKYTNQIRHRILDDSSDFYVRKRTIGGINTLFGVNTYHSVVKKCLLSGGHWDWNMCRSGLEFYVTKPSVVQHIGVDTGLHSDNNPDVAIDF